MNKKALVIHSGGMDSSICLALAKQKWGRQSVLSLSFFYNQRHAQECQQAAKICKDWGVDHEIIQIDYLKKLTKSALMDSNQAIEQKGGEKPNTWVCGRNGLFVRLGSIYAHSLGIEHVYLGIMESNSGYPDCNREYMDLMEKILRLDLCNPRFEICTPLAKMSKKMTLVTAHELGILDYLLKETISCYEGISQAGCGKCPSCQLRNQGIEEFLLECPHFQMPYLLTRKSTHHTDQNH